MITGETKKILDDLRHLNDTPEIIEGLQQNRVTNGKYNYWVGEAQVQLQAYYDIFEELVKQVKK